MATPKTARSGIKRELDGIAEELEGTPWKIIGKRLKAAKYKVKGDTVVITGSFSGDDLAKLIKVTASATRDDFKKVL